MNIYWGVIRICYVSTTCKSTDILLQYYIWMEMEKSKVLIEFLLIFRQSGDVLCFLYARRLCGYTATRPLFCERTFPWSSFFSVFDALCSSMIVPHRNHKCREFTRWPVASNKSNHKWRIMLADGGWFIHQEYWPVFFRILIEQNLLIIQQLSGSNRRKSDIWNNTKGILWKTTPSPHNWMCTENDHTKKTITTSHWKWKSFLWCLHHIDEIFVGWGRLWSRGPRFQTKLWKNYRIWLGRRQKYLIIWP